jgi:hypothetical protein
VFGVCRDVSEFRQAVELVTAGQDPRHRPEPVAAVEGALAAGDEHVGDDADAPTVGSRRGVTATDKMSKIGDEFEGSTPWAWDYRDVFVAQEERERMREIESKKEKENERDREKEGERE